MSYFERRAGDAIAKRAPEILEHGERLLICTACGAPELVFEAAMGATTGAEHQWIDATTFKCWDCIDAIDCGPGGARG